MGVVEDLGSKLAVVALVDPIDVQTSDVTYVFMSALNTGQEENEEAEEDAAQDTDDEEDMDDDDYYKASFE